VARPALGPLSTGLGEVFQYVLRSDTLSPRELRTLHHWVVRPHMLQVPGVAEINTWGGFEKLYEVVIDPARLLRYGLTLDDVARALIRDNRNASGGYVVRGGEASYVQGQGLVRGLDDLRGVVVASVEGTPVCLDDVAEVQVGSALRHGAVTADGRGEAVLGLGFMLIGENSRELSRRLEARLEEVKRFLPDGVEVTPMYSRRSLVDQVLATVRDHLLEGALLVVAVAFAFLGSVRAGVIVALTIPFSLLFAAIGMRALGVAASLMSLGAIDFGLVVDSSVILIENATRKLHAAGAAADVREVVRDALVEVRQPTLLGELTIASVYLPVLALEGVEGKLFQPMAVTVMLALAGSALASITLVPALASLALRPRAPAAGEAREGRLVGWLLRLYRPVLGFALERRAFVLACAAVSILFAAALAPRLGAELVPRLSEQSIVINTVRLGGVSLEESVRYGAQIERLLLARFPDEIEHVWTRTGAGEVATDPMGFEVSDVFVTLTPRARWRRAGDQEGLVRAMRAALEDLPGMRAVFTQPIEMRVNELDSGIRADVGVKLFGDEFEVLRATAEAIRRVVAAIPGAADVSVPSAVEAPLYTLEVDREAAGRQGIPAAEVLEVVEALAPRRVGEVLEGQRRFDLALRFDARARGSFDAIGRIPVLTPGGRRVPLSELTVARLGPAPMTIEREWARRRVVIQANAAGRDVGSFARAVERAVAREVSLPPGYTVSLGGQHEHIERAEARLLFVVPLALGLVFGLLYLTYRRASDALRVFIGVPFAAVGGVLALSLRGMPFSVSAAVGFVALAGVSVLGDMVLVAEVRKLEARGRLAHLALREAAERRLRPVLMTSALAALGFVPMAFGSGVGAEVQRPLATVVIGGMLTSTLATLVVLPVLYASARRPRAAQPGRG
jgi:cobalt-zinc-cadmium resistance protein CzcA